jgi:hypothetical protein
MNRPDYLRTYVIRAIIDNERFRRTRSGVTSQSARRTPTASPLTVGRESPSDGALEVDESAVECPIDKEHEAGDPEQTSNQSAQDEHRHPRATERLTPNAFGCPEPDDESSEARDSRVLHPRLGRKPAVRFHGNGRIVVRSLGLSSHVILFGRPAIS